MSRQRKNKKIDTELPINAQSKMISKPKAISLFSGMGGDSLGIEQAGFDVVAFNEIDKAAIESHKLNFPNSKLIVDDTPFEEEEEYHDETNTDDSNMTKEEKKKRDDAIKKREKEIKRKKKEKEKNMTNIQCIPDDVFSKYNGEVDLVFAGHPCQGFSNGGKKLPDDPRNTLFREFARVCRLVQPKYIIGENVDGLLNRKTSDGKKYFDVIKKEFEKIGYDVNHQVCHTVKYGVPQLRKRLVYVGIRKDLEKKYEFPKELNDGKVIDGKANLPNLQDIVKFDMEGAIKIEKDDFDMENVIPEQCIIKDLTNDDKDDVDNIHPYLRLKSKSRDVKYSGKTHHSLLSFQKRDSPIHCEIVDVRNPSKTIICTYDHQPRLFVPLQNKNGFYLRCLLPDELKQIQGFPADFKIEGNKKDKIKQIGNAVPPPLIKLIVQKLLE
jgi:DNA (cytosine-5)-methyltransferase 1